MEYCVHPNLSDREHSSLHFSTKLLRALITGFVKEWERKLASNLKSKVFNFKDCLVFTVTSTI